MSIRKSLSRKSNRKRNRSKATSRSSTRPNTVLGLQEKLLRQNPDQYEEVMRNPRHRAILRSPAFHQWYASRKPYSTGQDGFKRLTLPNVIRAFEIDSNLPAPSSDTVEEWEHDKVNRKDMVGVFRLRTDGKILHEDPSKGVITIATKSGTGIDIYPQLETANSDEFKEEFELEGYTIYNDLNDYVSSRNRNEKKKIVDKFNDLTGEEFEEWMELRAEKKKVAFLDGLMDNDEDISEYFTKERSIEIANTSKFKTKFDLTGYTIYRDVEDWFGTLSKSEQDKVEKAQDKMKDDDFAVFLSDMADNEKSFFLDSLIEEDGVQKYIDNFETGGLKPAGRRDAEGKYAVGSFAHDIAIANASDLKKMGNDKYLDTFTTYELERMKQAIGGTPKADDKKTSKKEFGGLIRWKEFDDEDDKYDDATKIKPSTKQLKELLGSVDSELFKRNIYNNTTDRWKTMKSPRGISAQYRREIRYVIKLKGGKVLNYDSERYRKYEQERDDPTHQAYKRGEVERIRGFRVKTSNYPPVFVAVTRSKFKTFRDQPVTETRKRLEKRYKKLGGTKDPKDMTLSKLNALVQKMKPKRKAPTKTKKVVAKKRVVVNLPDDFDF